MSSREFLRVKNFSVCGELTVKSSPVPRAQTGLHQGWLRRCGDRCERRGLVLFRRGGGGCGVVEEIPGGGRWAGGGGGEGWQARAPGKPPSASPPGPGVLKISPHLGKVDTTTAAFRTSRLSRHSKTGA